jgi:hypothetical protein
LQPWAAKARAASAPNPLEAPVIKTHLPESEEFIGRI